MGLLNVHGPYSISSFHRDSAYSQCPQSAKRGRVWEISCKLDVLQAIAVAAFLTKRLLQSLREMLLKPFNLYLHHLFTASLFGRTRNVMLDVSG